MKSGNATRIVMDAPPEREDCARFAKISGFLQQMHLNSPRVLAADFEQGFLLLTDLGSDLYLTQLRNDRGLADKLYDEAMTALRRLQVLGRAFQSELPPYDERLLLFELSLFRDWLCERHLGISFTESDETEWASACRLLVDNALKQPKVFVHRDYHSRNLMLTAENNPGILDFQDAVEGPLTYDLVSLLKDCYIRWPDEQVRAWALRFHARLDDAIRTELDSEQFLRHFDLMGAQRHLKAAGIFARLLHRDGKGGFLPDVPRTLRYVAALAPDYEEMRFLVDLITQRCLPALGQER